MPERLSRFPKATEVVMQITRQWLNENKTLAGGFLREQLKIVGVEWPPAKEWLEAAMRYMGVTK